MKKFRVIVNYDNVYEVEAVGALHAIAELGLKHPEARVDSVMNLQVNELKDGFCPDCDMPFYNCLCSHDS